MSIGECKTNPHWIVYMGTMRHPRVTIIVPLPLSMAALCYRNPLTWSSGISQGAAQAGLRRYLLEPPSQRSRFNLEVYRALRNASSSACAAAAAPASASRCCGVCPVRGCLCRDGGAAFCWPRAPLGTPTVLSAQTRRINNVSKTV